MQEKIGIAFDHPYIRKLVIEFLLHVGHSLVHSGLQETVFALTAHSVWSAHSSCQCSMVRAGAVGG
jgi:hypothetical protein